MKSLRFLTTFVVVVVVVLLVGGAYGVGPLRDGVWENSWARPYDPYRAQSDGCRAVLALLEPRPGMVIADIGAGAGFYSFLLADRVGRSGRVYATDVDAAMVRHMWLHKVLWRVPQLTPVHVDEDETGLADRSVDRILMVNVYLFREDNLREGREYLSACARALKPGGRLVISQDWVHFPAWHEQRGARDRARDLYGWEIAEKARPWFKVITREPRRSDLAPTPRVEEVGFYLVLEKKQVCDHSLELLRVSGTTPPGSSGRRSERDR